MSRFASVTRATFRKELRLLLRDRLCVALLACFSVGLAWSSWNTNSRWHEFANQQVEGQSAAREAWLSQSTVNAHMATHVGQTAYKPVSPLSGFDPGALADFGSTIFLQSHLQSTARKKPRENSVDLLQNEGYSPAVLLQLVGPLLIIVLGNASIAREKDGGTLSILLTTGSSWPAIAMGKGVAVLLVLLLVAIPGLMVLALPWFESSQWMHSTDLFVRQAIIFATLMTYYAGWIGVSMWVSSKSISMTGSFSLLIALWSIFALVMPRIAGDVATFASPLPTSAEIRVEKEIAIHDANQSSIEKAKADRVLEARLLEEFQVDRVEDLPIDMAGAQMIDQEAHANRLYDEIDRRVRKATNQQNEIIDGFQFASPYLAMRTVSSSLSATDRTHHLDFVNAAEGYRRQFVNDLNLAEMNHQGPGSSPEDRRLFWSRVSEFHPDFVSVQEDVKRSLAALILITLWAIAAVVVSFCSPPKINQTR